MSNRRKQSWNHRKGTIGKENVLTPLCRPFYIVESILIAGAVGGKLANAPLWMQIILIALAILFLLFYCGVYLFWSIKDPDRLQTESYNVATQEITTLWELSHGEDDAQALPPQGPIIELTSPGEFSASIQAASGVYKLGTLPTPPSP